MTIEIGTLVTIGIALAVLNYLSVFGALATLRWKDRREKRAIADIFIREVGEKLQTEASFQDIIKNMNANGFKFRDEEEDTNE